ncbi:uncharacterized protein [Palaemon carinicauda]|uniref:uncharacterized protein n=1 Tax=Palaemon carinicauda TaxID=392227 RepID=UPI0035B5E4B8
MMPLRKTTPRPTQDIQLPELEEMSDLKKELPIEPTLYSLVKTQDTTVPSGIVVQPKKRYRPSKKDIQDYPFTPEDKEMIVEFVRSHPTLYDKRDREWSNPRRKVELWRELAANFTNCTFQQVRKYFEARRTDFGKIEKKEHKRGSVRHRTAREEDVMATWAFLGGHISHERTIASDHFSPVSSHRTDADDSSSADMSGLSATLFQRRKRLKQKRPRTLTEERRPSADTPEATEGLLTQLTQIMTSINTLMPQAQNKTHRDITVFVQYLTQRLEYVPRRYQKPFFEQVIKLCHSLEGPEEEDATMKEAMARGCCSHWTPTLVEKGTQTKSGTITASAPQTDMDSSPVKEEVTEPSMVKFYINEDSGLELESAEIKDEPIEREESAYST